MPASYRVDLHCHSSLSDGELSPEQLADLLHLRGVQFAALTDHDTLEGHVRFKRALGRYNITAITGMEVLAHWKDHPIHLLGFGMDADRPELKKALFERRSARTPGASGFAPNRLFPAAESIALIHNTGGLAVLAHPLLTEPDEAGLKTLVQALKKAGLDGLEVYYPKATPEQMSLLSALAKEHSLVVTAGTDFHRAEETNPGPELPAMLWKAFRDALLKAGKQKSVTSEAQPPSITNRRMMPRNQFLINIVLPAAAALLFFITTLFGIFLPAFEKALLERKREMIKELTHAAWTLLDQSARDEQEGRLTREEAQAQACRRIENMRYGAEGKDYFWLQDLSPKMIMHPYRKELNGQDLSGFRDGNGDLIFKIFADLVRTKNEGYVDYVWQWKDKPGPQEAKESYVRLFEPWAWVIGTGIYMQDVNNELRQLTSRLAWVSAGITLVVALLLMYIIRAGLKLEQLRTLAEKQSGEATERYRTLVAAATEGALFLSQGRCRYANPVMLEFLQCSDKELELLDWDDCFPDVPENRILRENPESPLPIAALLYGQNSRRMECRVALRKVSDGVMALVRRIENPATGAMSGHFQDSPILKKLLGLPVTLAQDLSAEIELAEKPKDVITLCRKGPEQVQSLLDNGAYAPEIARMLSSITDAATRRLLSIAIKETGAPPVPFIFLALGSQGRQEQTLFTDQDNALVFQDTPENQQAETQSYFLKLSAFVCENLQHSGYRNCRGEIMAANPKWCQPLSLWKEYFKGWIIRAEPKELMEFNVFFDFRIVTGEKALEQDLRSAISGMLVDRPRFFAQAAQHALQFKAPMRLFGAIVDPKAGSEHPGQLDLKAAAMPIITFARLYALKEQMAETNTLARLEALARKGILLPSKQQEIALAHETLLRLRLRHQAATLRAGREPDNWVAPDFLGHIEEALLRECFKEVENIQNLLQREFLGSAPQIK